MRSWHASSSFISTFMFTNYSLFCYVSIDESRQFLSSMKVGMKVLSKLCISMRLLVYFSSCFLIWKEKVLISLNFSTPFLNSNCCLVLWIINGKVEFWLIVSLYCHYFCHVSETFCITCILHMFQWYYFFSNFLFCCWRNCKIIRIVVYLQANGHKTNFIKHHPPDTILSTLSVCRQGIIYRMADAIARLAPLTGKLRLVAVYSKNTSSGARYVGHHEVWALLLLF